MKNLKIFAMIVMVFFVGKASFALTVNPSQKINDLEGDFSHYTSDVEKAIKNVKNDLDIYVVTAPSLEGAANIEQFTEKLIKENPAWMNSSRNNLKNNLVLFVVSLNKGKRAIGLGKDFKDSISSQKGRIQKEIMGPYLSQAVKTSGDERGENLSKAMIAGIEEMDRLVDLRLHPGNAPSTVVVHNEKPVDYSGSWSFLLWIIVVLILGYGSWVAYSIYLRKEKEENARKGTQQKAKITKNKVVGLLSKLKDAVRDLESSFSVVKNYLSTNELETYSKKVDSAKSAQGTLAQRFSATDSSAGNPDVDDLSKDQYSSISSAYDSLERDIENLLTAANELKTKLEKVKKEISEFPIQISTLKKRVENLGTEIETATKNGLEVSSHSANIPDLLTTIESIDEVRKESVPEARKLLKDTEEMVTICERSFNDLISLVDDAKNGLKTANQNIAEAERLKTLTEKAMTELQERFDASTYQEHIYAIGKISDQTMYLSTATQQATEHISKQEWEKATDKLEVAEKAFSIISRAAQGVEECLRFLNERAVRIDTKYKEVMSLIDEGLSFIASNSNDIASSVDCRNQLQGKKTNLNAISLYRRDPQTTISKLEDFKRTVTSIIDIAKKEKSAIDEQRRQAEAARKKVLRDIEEARNYARKNSGKHSGNFDSRYDDLERQVRNAEDSADLATTLLIFGQLGDSVSHAHHEIKSEVDSWTPPSYSHQESRSSDNFMDIGGGDCGRDKDSGGCLDIGGGDIGNSCIDSGDI